MNNNETNTNTYKGLINLSGREYIPVYEIPPVSEPLQHDQYLIPIPNPTKEEQALLLKQPENILDEALTQLAFQLKGLALEVLNHKMNVDKSFICRPYQSSKFVNGFGIIIQGYVYGYSNESSVEYIENSELTGKPDIYVPVDTLNQYIRYLTEVNTSTAKTHTVIAMVKQVLGLHILEGAYLPEFYTLLKEKVSKVLNEQG